MMKILVSCLSLLLPRIISPTQSGFVPGRMLQDSVLLAQELVRDLGRGSRGGNVVLKLDMAKAYDRISWTFILQMLRAFGFSEGWISLIRRAIWGPWFSMTVNEVSQGFFQSQGGLWQGDPLSPCLFIIAAEYLSRGLDSLYAWFPGVAYSTGVGVSVSHLAFADDIIIFANGCRSSLQRVMDFLHHYEAASGQLVSLAKSSFYISSRASHSREVIARQTTGFQRRDLPFIYLGCLIYLDHFRISYFDEMIRKVRERISG